jgi:hypothetical protein
MNHYHQQYLDDISEPEGYEPSQDDITTCVDALLSNKELHFGGFVLELSDVADIMREGDGKFILEYTSLSFANQKDSERLFQKKQTSVATDLVIKYMHLKQMMPEIRSVE